MTVVLLRRGSDTRAVHTEQRPCEDIEKVANHLADKEKDLRQSQTCRHLHLGLLTFKTVRK